MNRNRIIIYITIVAVLAIIIIPTVYTVINNHNTRLLNITHKRIEEAARDCYLDEVCKDKKITLKELYENKYLEKENNPITKIYYNQESYVIVTKDAYLFREVK